MNELKVFENQEFGTIRTMDVDGSPWFVGKDVASALGYAKTENAISTHVDKEDKTTTLIQGDGSNYKSKTILINESGLYSLVLSSKLPGAKRYKRWVTNEVLPSIRSNGAYISPYVSPDFLRSVADKLETQERKIAEQERTIEAMQPRLQYLDTILECPGTVTSTQIAADYGISARKLNQILHDAHIQRFVNGQWILYAKYMGQGLAKSKTFDFTHADGTPDVKMTTVWTQKGRVVIHNILTERGFNARMDVEGKR